MANENATAAPAPLATNTVQTIFTIEMFDPKMFSWNRWEQRLRGAFNIFNIQEATKLHYLLHYMGNETFAIVCDKLHPADPTSKTYAEIVEIVTRTTTQHRWKSWKITDSLKDYKRMEKAFKNILLRYRNLQSNAILVST